MLPVVAMWGQRCGLDMTATTAMPLAVRTGLARSLWGGKIFRSCGMYGFVVVVPWQEDSAVLLRNCSNNLHKLDTVAHLVAAYSLGKKMCCAVVVD